MKIQCDMCSQDEATVYCAADEAALCAACDRRVHHANKLAGKHHRFSLLHSSPKQSPVCDICQENRAFLFCQQDRAILCTDCDVSIHRANEHTQKHTRFLLTGLKLSTNSTIYSESASAALTDAVPYFSKQNPLTSNSTDVQKSQLSGSYVVNSSSISSGSGISEYLIETLPGWHVEELLIDSTNFASPQGFCKSGENDVVMPSWDADLECNMSAFPIGQMGLWAPQVPLPPLDRQITQKQPYQDIKEFGGNNNSSKSSRKWSQESSLVVPQISPCLSACKRLRSSFS